MPLPAPRPRARKEIIVPGGHNSSPRRLNHALILAIARAKSWMRDLRNGTYADTIEIARQFQLNDAHVRRVLRFGYLAPDIVEAIIEGRQPRCLECYIETRISSVVLATRKRVQREIHCRLPSLPAPERPASTVMSPGASDQFAMSSSADHRCCIAPSQGRKAPRWRSRRSYL